MSFPFNIIFPLCTFASPAIASAISTWPFPETPAMANTSPPLIEKETSLTTSKPLLFLTVIFSTFNISCWNTGYFFCVWKDTSRPTIRLAICLVEAVATSNISINFPLQSIAHLSATFLISSNLCVMSIIVFPPSLKLFIISSKNSMSWGVKTAVG